MVVKSGRERELYGPIGLQGTRGGVAFGGENGF